MPLIVLGVVGLGVIAWAWLGIPARARRAAAAARAQRARMSAPEMARWALDVARSEQWDVFPAFARLEARASHVDDAELRGLLQALFSETVADDTARGRRGRDSAHFEWHDTGLASALEALEARTR